MSLILKGRPIVPGHVKGRALVSRMPISFLGGVDPNTGVIIERNHDLKGRSLKDKILCFPHGHGSTVGSYVIYSITKRNVGPKAIINVRADPVVVVGAVIADIPMMDQVDIEQIESDDIIEVDSEKGIIRVERKMENVSNQRRREDV